MQKMSDLDEDTITDAVLARFSNTPDPRLKEMVQSLVRHLHGFVRETEPTFEEWQTAIDFLTRTGHMCSNVRQEFILLSDVLGVSMLVDAINHRQPAGATETTVLGPFHVANMPVSAHGTDISSGLPGERLLVEGQVTSSEGEPVPTPSSRSGPRTRTGSTMCNEPTSTARRCARHSTPIMPAVSISGPSRRRLIPFRLMDRWANC
jgi:hypothetical protein